MGQLSDLADEYVDAAQDLDQLYQDLVSAEQYGLANQVSQAESNLKQAATNLYALDASITLRDQKDVETITNLTQTISSKDAQIAAAEDRVAVVTGLVASLVAIATDFGSGNVPGGIGAASQALATLGKL